MAEMNTLFTQVQGPLREVKPLRPAFGGLYCLERLQVTELEELEVATMAIALDLFFLKE